MFTGVQEATMLLITRFSMLSVKWCIAISNKHKNIYNPNFSITKSCNLQVLDIKYQVMYNYQ